MLRTATLIKCIITDSVTSTLNATLQLFKKQKKQIQETVAMHATVIRSQALAIVHMWNAKLSIARNQHK